MAEIESRAHSFMINFRFKVSDLRDSLNFVNSAADQIRGSTKLKIIMHTILSLGDALNGQEGSSAIRFGLHSILKLTEIRARNNKMTLMHYLCKVLADKHPDTLDFWEDLPDVEPASKIQKFLAEEMQAVSKELKKMEQVVSLAENDGSLSEHFLEAWEEFLSFAEDEVRALDSRYSVVARNVEAVIRFFGEDPSRCTFEKVASTLLYFVRKFEQAHDENASIVS